MADKVYGRGVVYAIKPDATLTVVGGAVVHSDLGSASISRGYLDDVELRGPDGDVIANVLCGRKDSLSLDVTMLSDPADNTLTNAESQGVTLEPGVQIQLGNFDDVRFDGKKFIVKSTEPAFSNNGAKRMRVTADRYADTDFTLVPVSAP